MTRDIHARAHGRAARHIEGATLIAQGEWRGRVPEGHAPFYTHLWSVGPDRFITDDEYHLTTPMQTHQEAHRADTAREIYDLLPEKLAPFPKARKARVAK